MARECLQSIQGRPTLESEVTCGIHVVDDEGKKVCREMEWGDGEGEEVRWRMIWMVLSGV